MSEQVSPRQQQLLANIATIIEALHRVPGVISVEVEDQPEEWQSWEKRAYVRFAGCDEPVVLEIY